MRKVLILGGYGAFGGKLATRLLKETEIQVLVAGRTLQKAQTFCAANGGTPVALDRSDTRQLQEVIKHHAPSIVIDACGPYQAYSETTTEPTTQPSSSSPSTLSLDALPLTEQSRYAVPLAAIAVGAHYLDLSDDASFTAGITKLSPFAERAGVCVLSGVSSVPALSSAVVTALSHDMECVDTIDMAILPGNQAPRGVAVMESILSQVGKPIRVMEGGVWTSVLGWTDTVKISVAVPGEPPVEPRWASRIGSPDLLLFPEYFGAKTVRFRAGLELKLLHGGLVCLAWLPRLGLVRSLGHPSYVGLLHWIAERVTDWGSDRGGMVVDVVGELKEVSSSSASSSTDHGSGTPGQMVHRRWTLLAEKGHGPFIPIIPAELLTKKLLMLGQTSSPPSPTSVSPPPLRAGARPCLSEFSLAEAEAALSTLHTFTHTTPRREHLPLFASALGDAFSRLHPAVQELHRVVSTRNFQGRANIIRGSSWLAWLAATVAGLPPTADSVPVKMCMQRSDGLEGSEVWTRQFGACRMVSHLSTGVESDTCDPNNTANHQKNSAEFHRSRRHGVVYERMGPVTFEISLRVERGSTDATCELQYPFTGGWFLGVPLPQFCVPGSETAEKVDAQGRSVFHVVVRLPPILGSGLLIQYEGYLVSVEAEK